MNYNWNWTEFVEPLHLFLLAHNYLDDVLELSVHHVKQNKLIGIGIAEILDVDVNYPDVSFSTVNNDGSIISQINYNATLENNILSHLAVIKHKCSESRLCTK